MEQYVSNLNGEAEPEHHLNLKGNKNPAYLTIHPGQQHNYQDGNQSGGQFRLTSLANKPAD